MKLLSVTAGVASALALVAGSSASAVTATRAADPIELEGVAGPRLSLYPAVVLRGRSATIEVSGLEVPSLEVRVAGATVNLGHPLPWTALRPGPHGWRAALPAPELRGVYPLELRVRPGSPILRSEHWLMRVYARGTQARPTFGTPEGVARWWVRTVPLHATLVAVKRWPQPAFDRRDGRLHQLLVVAYSPEGHSAVRDRLGMFVTAVRDRFHGGWRLLEATVQP